MDLIHALEDQAFLRAVAEDTARDTEILQPVVQTCLFGSAPCAAQAHAEDVAAVLRDAARNADHVTLQYIFLVVLYLSDTLAACIHEKTHEAVFNTWFYGREGTSIVSFRQRMERALCGRYGGGDRGKGVLTPAETPVETATREIRLAYFARDLFA